MVRNEPSASLGAQPVMVRQDRRLWRRLSTPQYISLHYNKDVIDGRQKSALTRDEL